MVALQCLESLPHSVHTLWQEKLFLASGDWHSNYVVAAPRCLWRHGCWGLGGWLHSFLYGRFTHWLVASILESECGTRWVFHSRICKNLNGSRKKWRNKNCQRQVRKWSNQNQRRLGRGIVFIRTLLLVHAMAVKSVIVAKGKNQIVFLYVNAP